MNANKYCCKYLIILLLCFPFYGLSQNLDLLKDTTNKKCILLSTNFLRIAFDEVPLFLEFPIYKNIAIELNSGIIYSNPFLKKWYVRLYSSPRFFHNGYYIGTGIKFYSKSDKLTFTQFNIIYKYKDFEKEYLWLGGMSGSDHANELFLSQYLHQLNFNVRLGYRFNMSKVSVEQYGGVGINTVFAKTIYHNSRFGLPVHKKDRPIYDNGTYFAPTIHLGFKIGLQYNFKK